METKMAALLLDDEEGIVEAVRETVQLCFPDLQFLCAKKVAKAEEIFIEWEDKLVLVLIDILLEGESGFDFFHWIDQHKANFRGLVAGFTACPTSLKQLRSEGCSRILEKPCSTEEIEQLVQDGIRCYQTPQGG